MFEFAFLKDFYFYFTVLTFAIIISTLWYFWFVVRPYAQFPSCRLEHRIPYWILKRVPLHYAVFQAYIEHARRYESEGMFTAWLGMPCLVVYGKDIVKKVIQEPAAVDKCKLYKLFEYAIGEGILTSNGETWKKQWKMAAPAFHKTALKSYTPLMNKCSEEMIERLSALNGQPTDNIMYIVSLCAIGIIHETNFAEKEKDIKEYTHVMKVLHTTTDFFVKRLWSPWLYFDFALQFFPSAREAHKLITDLLKDNLKPRLENIKKSLIAKQALPQASLSDLEFNGKRLKSFGESFVEQHLADPTITMDEVTQQVSLIVGAGFHTVLHSVTYALYLLGTHKDVQERAFGEVMSETEGYVTNDSLRRLTYLECVIKEALRLYPVPIIGRYLTKDLYCGKHKIPQNTTILIFSYMLHRNPEIYPNPEKFDPERFMDKNSEIKSWNHIPFAEGSRQCIGKNFAMNEMKIMLAHVLWNFEIIALEPIEEKDLYWTIVLGCTKNFRMQFVPRRSTVTEKQKSSESNS